MTADSTLDDQEHPQQTEAAAEKSTAQQLLNIQDIVENIPGFNILAMLRKHGVSIPGFTDAPKDPTIKSYEIEMATVLTWMHKSGITQIIANYSGGGDEGKVDKVFIDGKEDHGLKLPARLNNHVSTTMDADMEYKPHQVERDVLRTIEDIFIDNLAFNYVSEAGHSGFEDNDGGRGVFTVNADGNIRLEHTDFSKGSEDKEDILLSADDELVGSGIKTISAWLNTSGMAYMTLDFEGSCCEVNEWDVSVFDSTEEDSEAVELEDLSEVTLADESDATIEDCMESLGKAIIARCGYTNFEDNNEETDGGSGQIRINRDGSCVVAMSYTVYKSNEYINDFSVTDEMLSAVTKPSVKPRSS